MTNIPQTGLCSEMDGVDETIDCGDVDAFDGLVGLTISGWFKVDVGEAGISGVCNKGTAAPNAQFSVNLLPSFTLTSFQVSGDGTTGFGLNASLSTGTGTWFHGLWMYSGFFGVLQFYENGVFKTQVTGAPASLAGNSESFIIGTAQGASPFYQGRMKHLKFYSTIFNAAQVLKIYKCELMKPASRIPGIIPPISWWPLDDPSSFPTAKDVIGGNDGTYTNMELGDILADSPVPPNNGLDCMDLEPIYPGTTTKIYPTIVGKI